MTFGGQSYRPVWNPEGTEIAFGPNPRGAAGAAHIYRTSANGVSEATSITNAPLMSPKPTSWSPDGAQIIVEIGFSDLQLLDVEGGSLSTFVDTPFNESAGMFSPDGRFVAHESDETGREEVFVVSFPEPSRKWQISSDGGRQPRWSRDGDELFYRAGTAMMAVSVQTQVDFRPPKPRILFEAPSAMGTRFDPDTDYDVLANDEGFVMVQMETTRERAEFHVILNWFEDLKRLAPANN